MTSNIRHWATLARSVVGYRTATPGPGSDFRTVEAFILTNSVRAASLRALGCFRDAARNVKTGQRIALKAQSLMGPLATQLLKMSAAQLQGPYPP